MNLTPFPPLLSLAAILLQPLAAASAQNAAPTPPSAPPQAPSAPAPSEAAPADPAIEPATNQHVRLKNAAFGREYLLSASLIPQLVAATGTALSGKIVRFERFHDGVDLYESNRGLLVTDALQARRLLTTFPIVAQDDDGVVIDFNAGIRRVFNDKWYSSSETPTSPHRASLSQPGALEVPQSRVFDVRREGRQLILRQSALVRDRQNDPNREERVEVRYFLTPYETTFQTKEHSPEVFKHVRFFETQPQIEDTTGRISSRIALFDIRQPVTFHYSANTPPELVDAVRDGILYWNRAFGRDVVKAEKAPEGVTAPDSQLNLVQWVPWDSAGFAYADVILDPRTGASLRGQAFLTSTFSFGGRGIARALLRNLRAQAAPPKAGTHAHPADTHPTPQAPHAQHAPLPHPGLPWFGGSRTCECDPTLFAQNAAAGLEAILADPKLNDEAVRRISGDYVRETVAHEVGHILGLRHNFAGSLAATLTPLELEEWLSAYIADDKTQRFEDRLASASVMDYNSFYSVLFNGWKIRRSKGALPHDHAAIQWGYLSSLEVAQKKMLFGTDQDIGTYPDSVPFDFGAEPLIGAFSSLSEQLRLLPNAVIEEFIAARAPRNPADRRPLEQVSLDPDRAALRSADLYAKMLSWLSAQTRSLRIERRFDFVGPLNRKEVLYAHWKSANEQIDKLGGIDRAFFSMFPIDWKLDLKNEPVGARKIERIDAKQFSSRLAKLLESPSYSEFIGLDEQPASFSKEEKALILKRGEIYFEEYQKRVLKALCQRLERATRDLGVQALEEVAEDDAVSKLEKRIIELAREVLLARNEEVRHRGKVDRALAEVVDFRFDLDTRISAGRMLAESAGSFKGWATEARTDLTKQLKEAVDASLNLQHLKDFKESMLSRTLRDWYLQQQNVLNAIGSRSAPPMPFRMHGGMPPGTPEPPAQNESR